VTGAERERGAVLAVVAISLTFLISVTAITIDLGRLSLRRRDMQAIADMVSLDMARLLNGRTNAEILSPTAVPKWDDELRLSAERNDFTSSKLSYRLGDMDGATFVENEDPAHRSTAVEITATDDLDYFFAPGGGSVTRKAIGTLGAKACISIGSFAAAYNANPSSLLGTLLGKALNASVVSYSGLANAQVTLADIATNLGFGTPSELLTATVNRKDFYLATANALRQAGDAADATVLESIAAATNSSSTFDFGDLVHVDQGGEQAALSTAFNVLDLVAGSAFLANGTNALSIPSLGLSIPGLTSASASVQVIQAPQSGCGSVGGPPVRTSQVQVTLDLTINLGGLLGLATVHITQTLASATGTLANPLSCGPPALVNVAVSSALVTTSITQRILGIPLTITPAAQGAGGSTVSFIIPPDSLNRIKRSGSGDIGLAGTNISGLNVLLQPVLNTVFTQVDAILLHPMSQFVGITVAGADVEVLNYSCNVVTLAQ